MLETAYLSLNDITENIAIIKFAQSYRQNMSALELYEVARGVWKCSIERAKKTEYCLAVANGVVIEVYKADNWYIAGTVPMTTRHISKEDCVGRIEFSGGIAENHIRSKYIGKNVQKLYKKGEANPIKIFEKQPTICINTLVKANMIKNTNGDTTVQCPTCKYMFTRAKRCPECGQLINYEE